MGEALSTGDVLSLLTIILVLRVVFLVPLINLDKAKTVAAKIDPYWERQQAWVAQHPGDEVALRPYRNAFGLHGWEALATTADDGRLRWIEASSPDSALIVVQHDLHAQTYVALRVQNHSSVASFRRGRLLWSPTEGEWFIQGDSTDYGGHPASLEMQKRFRAWTTAERGY